ncbi:hypothetical protein PIROE2DRAFT_10585 [Piromyces sp. E2]|nr:hypothetical protein PIROE2DRAFT_10585 [Piromyces sp. E2]|eukprot:OUM63003.1 hypothetical protein PIROE2DRAFT_10585 [Piromyces sp. E2]
MVSKKFTLISLALLCIQAINGNAIDKRDINPVNKAFENICKVIRYHSNGELACNIGKLFTKDKYLHVVPLGQCKDIGVDPYGVTEICSSAPYQLYFKAAKYEVNGCYQMGEPHKTYMQCCQFRHAFNWLVPNSPYAINPVAQTHIGTFCSGPKNGDPSFKSAPGHGIPFNLNNKDHTLLYYQTKLVEETCNKNKNSEDCNHAIEYLELAFDKDHGVKWNTVKNV